MALSELETRRLTKRLTAYCEGRIPLRVRHQLRLGFRIRGHEVVLFEERPAFRPPHEWREHGIAKFRYVATQQTWYLYCQYRDLRWHGYEPKPRAKGFDALLGEVDADPTGIFWG
jgi:Protein of unknown function (DUF3024)